MVIWFVLISSLIASRAELVTLTARRYLDFQHKYTQDGVIVIDGVLHGTKAVLSNGKLIVPSSQLAQIGKNTVNSVAIHLESHAINWPGWKQISGPLHVLLESSNSSFPRPCDEVIAIPSFFFGAVAYPMYGHVMFNCHSNLMHTISKFRKKAYGEVLLFGSLDFNPQHHKTVNQPGEYLKLLPVFEKPFGDLALDKRVHSFDWIQLQSRERNICFEDVTVGLTDEWDHYNLSTLSSSWQSYAADSRRLANITELPQASKQHCIATLIYRPVRKILNLEVLSAIVSQEFDCVANIVSFDGMSHRDQILVASNSTLLIGMDGTGLLNAAYLQRPSAVISIMMWGMKDINPAKGRNFQHLALKTGGCWQSFHIDNRNETVFSPKFAASIDSLLESRLSRNKTIARMASETLVSAFSHQDSVVNLTNFRFAVRKALDCVFSLNSL